MRRRPEWLRAPGVQDRIGNTPQVDAYTRQPHEYLAEAFNHWSAKALDHFRYGARGAARIPEEQGMVSEDSESCHVTGHPRLDADGVTIWQRYGGRAPEGFFYDGWHTFVPGDPRYDELLPVARRYPLVVEECTAPIHPGSLAKVKEMLRKTREWKAAQ